MKELITKDTPFGTIGIENKKVSAKDWIDLYVWEDRTFDLFKNIMAKLKINNLIQLKKWQS